MLRRNILVFSIVMFALFLISPAFANVEKRCYETAYGYAKASKANIVSSSGIRYTVSGDLGNWIDGATRCSWPADWDIYNDLHDMMLRLPYSYSSYGGIQKRCYTYPQGYSDNGNWISGNQQCSWPADWEVINDIHDIEIRATDSRCSVTKRCYTTPQGYSDNGNWIPGTQSCSWPADWDVTNDVHDIEIKIDCAPTASITGPTSLSVGQAGEYRAAASDPDGNLNKVGVYATPTSTQDWRQGWRNECTASGSYGSCSNSYVFQAGTYYVVTNAYDSSGKQCSGNPWCNWGSGGCAGWYDCGSSDALGVTVYDCGSYTTQGSCPVGPTTCCWEVPTGTCKGYPTPGCASCINGRNSATGLCDSDCPSVSSSCNNYAPNSCASDSGYCGSSCGYQACGADGWYSAGVTQSFQEGCTNVYKSQQEYRDYYCASSSGCAYRIDMTKGESGYQWVATGYTTPATGGSCDDGNACTRSDTCSNGACRGTSYSCPAAACGQTSCNGAGGCTGSYVASTTSCGTTSCASGATGTACNRYCNGAGTCGTCTPSCTETDCYDRIDNDNDGNIDMQDTDCAAPTVDMTFSPEPVKPGDTVSVTVTSTTQSGTSIKYLALYKKTEEAGWQWSNLKTYCCKTGRECNDWSCTYYDPNCVGDSTSCSHTFSNYAINWGAGDPGYFYAYAVDNSYRSGYDEEMINRCAGGKFYVDGQWKCDSFCSTPSYPVSPECNQVNPFTGRIPSWNLMWGCPATGTGYCDRDCNYVACGTKGIAASCSGSTYYPTATCQTTCQSGTVNNPCDCTPSQSPVNCDSSDGWAVATPRETRLIDDPTNSCKQVEQLKQVYRDYSCNAASGCVPAETNTQWVNTGTTTNKPDGTACTGGACRSGTCVTTPPTGTITINNGATYTTSTSVTLTLSCTGANGCSQMQLENAGLASLAAEPYATSRSWTLPSGDGTKTVYASFKDNANNWMVTAASDSIILDSTPPTTTIKCNGAACSSSWYTQGVSVTFECSDGAGSGCASTRYCIGAGCTSYSTYSNAVSLSSQGTNVIQFYSTDNAGNTETTKSGTVNIDTTPPTITHDYTSKNDKWQASAQTIRFTASDSQSGLNAVKACKFKLPETTCTTSALSASGSSYPFSVDSNGDWTVRYEAIDNAGNTAPGTINAKVDSGLALSASLKLLDGTRDIVATTGRVNLGKPVTAELTARITPSIAPEVNCVQNECSAEYFVRADTNFAPVDSRGSGSPWSNGVKVLSPISTITYRPTVNVKATVSYTGAAPRDTTASATVNMPPVISNVVVDPLTAYLGSEVTFSADVIDDTGVQSVQLCRDVSLAGVCTPFGSSAMARGTGNTYSVVANAPNSAGPYPYDILAIDVDGMWSSTNGRFGVEGQCLGGPGCTNPNPIGPPVPKPIPGVTSTRITGTIEYPAVTSRVVKLITSAPAGGMGTCTNQVKQTDNKGNTVTGCPNVTKSMPVDFIVKANVEKAIGGGRCSGESGAAYSCSLSSSLPGVTISGWDPFVQGWRGRLDTDAIPISSCDSFRSLIVTITLLNQGEAGLPGTAKSDIYIDCNPRIVVEPLERRVVLGQKNIEAFNVTIYNPRYDASNPNRKDYTLRMEFRERAEEKETVQHMFSNFECRDCTAIKERIDSLGLSTTKLEEFGLLMTAQSTMLGREPGLQEIGTSAYTLKKVSATINNVETGVIPPKNTLVIKLSEIGAARAGVYPLKFVAEASPEIEGEGVLMVFAEGLDDFAAWQLIAMVMFAMLVVFAGVQKKAWRGFHEKNEQPRKD